MAPFKPSGAKLILSTLGVALAGMTLRVGYLQTYGRQATIGRAERQQYQTEMLAARRGSIYDRVGSLLAGTVQTQTVFVDPKFIQQHFESEGRSLVQMDEVVARLARLIDKQPFEISQLISDRADARFVKLAEHLDENTCKAITALNIPGVGLMADYQRYYPMGSLAAHVLGGVGKEGKGLEGTELQQEKLLAGKDGSKRILKDARRRGIGVTAEDYLPPSHGQHLILTIDANIQLIAEQELAIACQKNRASRGEVIIIDPRNGDILALANYPTFNPQNLDDSAAEVRRNNCLVSPFEPGSALKPFIAGPAIAARITHPAEVWPIGGINWFTPYGRKVSDVHGYGPLTTWDILVKSSNIGMCMLAERMGNPAVQRALSGFGFGKTTGIDLPGEDPGLLNPLAKWSKFSTDSVAQGYELMVTPLQLGRAMCAYANGGRLVQPRLVKGVLDADGNLVSRRSATPANPRQAIDPAAAATVRRILADVPVRGTATKARSAAWNLFGKTGTAHISRGKAGYAPDKFNSTFLGGGPVESPRLVIAMVVHEADKKIAHYGGTVSAPNAGRILERALAYLQMPESPQLPLPPQPVMAHLVNFNPKVYNKTVATVMAE